MSKYYAGIDVGSTTVKLALLDEKKQLIFGKYQRHYAHIQETLSALLKEARGKVGDCLIRPMITGSGALSLGKALKIEFVQEVEAVASSLKFTAPETDVAIELGGEDAKIIYFDNGIEERMNGVCAGGTGSFIDQMASLLQTDAGGLNEAASHAEKIYPIAARCGVFAKSDIQPLINEGATREDLAASIFQAVVNQTISGLACGKPIRGHVAFLGGPLHFLPELKNSFIKTLRLTPETTIDPENSHLFAAMGAALEAGGEVYGDQVHYMNLDSLIDRLDRGVSMHFELKRLDPLFEDEADYQAFKERHGMDRVQRGDLSTYEGNCFLGIDAGSTTTKLALIGEKGELLFSHYISNQGETVRAAIETIRQMKNAMPEGAKIVRACSTGYGEMLLKSAFNLEENEVETIAHCTAASWFDPKADCVLDIGGQDMKCIKLKDGSVDNILLNESCSSGCGSFIENFAQSLGHTAESFAKEALFAKHPIDLGSRCTVFMNSNVKQAQKEGAGVDDISAGLAYSVIKNALYKVIKLVNPEDLGTHVVVQGGTFYNEAVLRAFEKISGCEAICPDISGIMGAFGAALLARDRYHGQQPTMLPLDEILDLSYTTTATRCRGCENQCHLTINRFSGGRRYISGNRCEKGLGGESAGKKKDLPNLAAYKLKRLFDYPTHEVPKRGVLGVPRVLNMYENYPFWATFFYELGFKIVLSPASSRELYERGIESIPSETECYPAKMAHGHVQWLIDQGITTIFHPCVFYEYQENPNAQNHYNCPMVVSYAENLKNDVEAVTDGEVRYLRPFMAMTSEKTVCDRLIRLCKEEWNIPKKEVMNAVAKAWAEQRQAKDDIRAEGQKALDWMEKEGAKGIVLAGRPYHIDPEINHGIPEMINSYGLAVLTEDSLPVQYDADRPLRVTDQWVYHSRLYSAAEFVSKRTDLEIIQLNSFGCGLDAVTSDQVLEILEKHNKLYTVLKIDEVNNLGAARIRFRSLLAAMKMRDEKAIKPKQPDELYSRAEFTQEMFDQHYTILAPRMLPIHFDILQPLCHEYGFMIEVLKNDNRNAIDTGLRFVNNDACYPSITVIGQIMDAVLSGDYDTDHLAILMAQTGGCCRASNYVSLMRRALEKAGMAHIPVISLNTNGMETNEGFHVPNGMYPKIIEALVYGDLLMRCLYRVRPYELEEGSADALYEKWKDIAIESLVHPDRAHTYKKVCEGIVEAFDTLPIDEELEKPRVGVVGEILVKYMPLANNDLVRLLEKEGAEAVVPDLMDFFNFCVYNQDYKHKYLGTSWTSSMVAHLGIEGIRILRMPALKALEKSRRFEAPMRIEQVAKLAKPFLSIGNQYGEGWFLTGEMVELITSGVTNILCVQPFACLPNHVVGKGTIKMLRKTYPQANIAAVDYDSGASEVNQLNRIKLMLASARKEKTA